MRRNLALISGATLALCSCGGSLDSASTDRDNNKPSLTQSASDSEYIANRDYEGHDVSDLVSKFVAFIEPRTQYERDNDYLSRKRAGIAFITHKLGKPLAFVIPVEGLDWDYKSEAQVLEYNWAREPVVYADALSPDMNLFWKKNHIHNVLVAKHELVADFVSAEVLAVNICGSEDAKLQVRVSGPQARDLVEGGRLRLIVVGSVPASESSFMQIASNYTVNVFVSAIRLDVNRVLVIDSGNGSVLFDRNCATG